LYEGEREREIGNTSDLLGNLKSLFFYDREREPMIIQKRHLYVTSKGQLENTKYF
jgi:hypothetical protein